MLKLEDIKRDAVIEGLDPSGPATVRFVEPVGPDALTVNYRLSNGESRERVVFRNEEASLSPAEAGLPWAFDADGEDFKLAAEAYRITLAHLFDPMMAVHTSNVEPLPHQITAVYEAMLPRQPLRFVLADDPGAGKTIMAGLLIKEMIARADARRILIVAPGSLVEQWQEELDQKFGLEFHLFSREMEATSRTGNPFQEQSALIARVDQISRRDDLIEKLEGTQWDLVIVDEAHKMAAHWTGMEVNETKRFKLGKVLGRIARHYLLMTATPHNGKEEDFQLFLSLLDGDRFYGKFRGGTHKVDVSDLMRRMVKEDLVRFDSTPLFPERRAYTVMYELSPVEESLYEAVTTYVQDQWDLAQRLDGKRKGTVGFALTSLQRRLASSPEAIYQSLRRRCERLKSRLDEERVRQQGGQRASLTDLPGLPSNLGDVYDSADEFTGSEFEELEDEVTDRATAAQTIAELEKEIWVLEDLVGKARRVRDSGLDRKWDELSRILQNTPEMKDARGVQRKLLVFTEHRDTLNYLTEKIRDLLGQPEAVEVIHGGTRREDRRDIQARFRQDPTIKVLIATDAAGEGVNLQVANLMVNYDLPWNPNRMEQRFGRIHRIGQREVCHLWNMVAARTREGEVFKRLFEKLETARAALGGRVFDVLGEVFENRSLKDMLIDAIRYGERPDVRARLDQQVANAFDRTHLESILRRHAICQEVMDAERLFAIRAEMERAEARKLQPYFIRSFFEQAFKQLGGDLRRCETGRFEIPFVPGAVRERDRLIGGRNRANPEPVVPRYERVCFEKQYVQVPGKRQADLLHPGHPLVAATTDIILERHRPKLTSGAVLLDPTDMGLEPKLLLILEHSVKEGGGRTVSQRLQFVEIAPSGAATRAGWAPHLDLQRLDSGELRLVDDILHGAWLKQNLSQVALSYAAQNMVSEHFDEVKARREDHVERTLRAVHERLSKELTFQQHRLVSTRQEIAAGRQPRVQEENVRRLIDELTARLQARTTELQAMRHVVSSPPLVVGGALVIPQGLLLQRRGVSVTAPDADARARVEALAMKAVMDAERAMGCQVIDVSAEKCGWDVTSLPPPVDGKAPLPRHIEVKGRAKDASTVTVTKNEMFYGYNQGDKFILAIVLVDGDEVDEPLYVRRPFDQEPGWAVTSVNLDLGSLLERAQPVHATFAAN